MDLLNKIRQWVTLVAAILAAIAGTIANLPK